MTSEEVTGPDLAGPMSDRWVVGLHCACVRSRAEDAAGAGRRERSRAMTRYSISIDDGAMSFRGGSPRRGRGSARGGARGRGRRRLGVRRADCIPDEEVSVVATDGTVTVGPYPESKAAIGGSSVVDVPSREDALKWSGRIAVACRCAQEVREFARLFALIKAIGERADWTPRESRASSSVAKVQPASRSARPAR